MSWFVRYKRRSDADEVEETETPDQAVETACLLMDEGCQVSAIGWGSLKEPVAAAEIARIHDLWVRVRPVR